MLRSIHLGCTPPDVETAEVRPQLDGETLVVDGYFILDLVRVDRLRADGADLACSLPSPHLRWRGKEDSAVKAIKYGLEACHFGIVRPTGESPPRVQPATVDGYPEARLHEAAAGREDD